jgi:HAD superfamily phosphoserine phosphatase-like hydrolase
MFLKLLRSFVLAILLPPLQFFTFVAKNTEAPTPAKRKALVMDLDGTFVRWQLFIYLIEVMHELGLLPEDRMTAAREATDAYRRRQIPWERACDTIVRAYQGDGMMRGITRDDFVRAAKTAVERYGEHVHVFTRELAAICTELGYVVIYISGSPTEIVGEFANRYRVEHFVGTEHPHQNGVYTGGEPRLHVYQKGETLQAFAERLNLDLAHSIAIGDTGHDAPALQLVRYPICIHPNGDLLAAAAAHGWPVVLEKKTVWILRILNERHLCRASLGSILPEEVAVLLKEKLRALNLYMWPN